MDELYPRILPAVEESWGGPDDDGAPAEYIRDVARACDLPAYFRAMERLACEGLTEATLSHFHALFDPDAQFILRSGLEYLQRDGRLTPDEQVIASAMLKLQDMAFPNLVQPDDS